MTLIERLRTHKGDLLRIKSELYWYGGRGWDGVPGRICLVLDATAPADVAPSASTPSAMRLAADDDAVASALLLVDGAPHWVWVVAKDIELLDGGDQ